MSGYGHIRALTCSLILLAPAGLFAAQGKDRSGQATNPPGFGLVTVQPAQTIRINLTCFGHTIGRIPPGPCHGLAMFHDSRGDVLKQAAVDLRPGESGFMEYTPPRLTGDVLISPVGIDPCWVPAAGGTVIPTVEVLDNGGNLLLFENVATPRMSEFNNAFTNPETDSGFNPTPDPPGFGMITVTSTMKLRMNTSCFAHTINGIPPGPCRGTVMVHDMAGNVIQQTAYDLKPGQTASFEFTPPPTSDRTSVHIDPCWLPAEGGRAVPDVELVDASSGQTRFVVNAAAARVSQFQ